MSKFRVAIVQRPPVLLDLAASLERALAALGEAAREGARLVVFPETYLPGYPAWIWRLRPGADAQLSEQLHAALLAQAVPIDGEVLRPLAEAAREHAVTVVCGVHERDTRFSRATLYNSVVVFGPDGELLHRHRKLMPTHPERMVWGFGDGSSLRAVDTPVGRLGCLICWENYMPLARTALYAQGVQLYVAPTYDCGDRWIASMQHIAKEGGCWVLGAGTAWRAADMPADLPGRAQLYPDESEWINPGDSVVVEPGGRIVAGPLRKEFGLLLAEIDLERVAAAKRTLDVCGHYARPDVLQLLVDRRPQAPVRFEDGPG